jgi:hypothetical protein
VLVCVLEILPPSSGAKGFNGKGQGRMPLLDITSFLGELDKVLEDPAWIFFALVGGIGLLGLIALMLLYPISRDPENPPGS